MSVKEFESRTSLMALRGAKLNLISLRLKEYIQDPSDQTLQNLWLALDNWQKAHSPAGSPDGWMQDRRNAGGAIADLTNWVKRKTNADAIIAFRRAAIDIHDAYGNMMDETYRKPLVDIFINSEVDSVQPFTSLIHYRNQQHWQDRLIAKGWKPSQGKTDGLTSAWTAGDIAFTSRKMFAAIPGQTPPLNRIVEVPVLNHHTISHELLHWVTHESFKAFFSNSFSPYLRPFIMEGLTEFLTRKALNEWDQGGYVDLVPLWVKMMSSNKAVHIADIEKAYFRGSELEAFQRKIRTYTSQDPDYQKAQGAAMAGGL